MAKIKVVYNAETGLQQIEDGEEGFDVGASLSQSGPGGTKANSTLEKLQTTDDQPVALRTVDLGKSKTCLLKAEIVWKNKSKGTSGFLVIMANAHSDNGDSSVGPTKIVADNAPTSEDAYFVAVDESSKVQVLVMAPPGSEDSIEWSGKVSCQEL